MNKSEYESIFRLENNFWWYKVLHCLVEDCVLEVGLNKNQNILDAGCGTGRMLEIIQYFGITTGIDYSPEAIRLAKTRGLQNLIQGDLNDYEFEEKCFDIIISLDVLYHAAIISDTNVLSKFYNSLKPGGVLILNLPAFEYLRRSHDIAVHTKRRYRKKELIKILESIGFKIIKASYRLPHLYLIILLSKFIDKLKSKKSSESDLKKIPDWINNLLFKLGSFENFLIKKRLYIPVGSSVFIVATK